MSSRYAAHCRRLERCRILAGPRFATVVADPEADASPQPPRGEALVQVHNISICGTDVSADCRGMSDVES